MSRQQQQRIDELLKKTEHFDADERYMAVHDLMEDIKNDVEIEAKDVARIRDTLVTMLNDKSGDVSTIATKSLAILVRKLQAAEIGPIVNKLASLIIDTPQASSRDTWTDGLKGILANTPQEHGKLIAPDLTTALLKALSTTSASAKRTASKEEPEDTIAREMMVLDILKDVLTRFGEEVTVSHDDIVKVLLPLLDHPVDDMRKKANATLGAASSLLSEKPFQVVMERLINGIQHASPSPGLYTFIQSIGVVSAAAGLRIAPYLARIVPKLISFCEFKSGKDEEDEANQQLWENCLQTFQSILYRCPQAMDDYINKIIGLSLRFLAYDPLYADDSDAKGPADMDVDAADGGWGGGDDSGWGGDADGFDGFGDTGAADKGAGWGDDGGGVAADADVSWRIRRAAVGVLTAFIHVRSDILKEYYAQLLESLLKRFKERDPAVKEELFLCCRDLLRQTVVTKKEVDDRKPKSLKIPVITRGRSYLDAMDVMVKQLVDTIHAEFGKSKPAIQRAMCATLRELMIVRHLSGDLSEFLPVIIPDILSGVASADPLLKSDSLTLLHLFVEYHTGPVLAPHFAQVCDATCESIAKDRHPSSKAEGLRIVGVLATKAQADPAHAAALKKAFSVVHQQLVVKDSDEAVKQTSIASMATLLATQTNLFVSEVPKVVPMFVDRFANVGTVTPALHAITTLANAPSNLDLSPVLKPATLKDISSFLRKVDVELKYTAATTLEALVHKYSSAISPAAYTDLVNETLVHISDADLQLATHVLRLYNTILTYQPAAVEVVGKPEVMNRILNLCLSPLVQASALQTLLALFSTFVEVSKGSGPLSYNSLLSALLQTSASAPGVSKTSLQSVAMVIAAMSSKADAASVNATVSRFADTVKDHSASEHTQELALLVLGALGKQRDLSSHAGLEEIVFSALSSKSDRVRHAAAFALGNIAVGRLNTYVPKLLQLMKSKPDQLYLLLTALKELITACSESNNEGLAAFTDAISPILLENAEHKEEGARGMAAECLGKLATMDGIKIVPQLQQLSQSKSARLRAASIMAVRFALCNNNLMLLRDGMKAFLGLLQDGDLEARRQSALTVNSFARNDEGLSLLDEYLKSLVVPILYNTTTIDQTLLEVRDFGAFTETFDHGEPLRSAAFQCLATLLEEAPHRLNLSAFASNMKKGIEDSSSEIQLLTCHVFLSLAENFPSAALEALDSLQPCFQKAVKGRMNELQTGNQRAGEVLRSLIRTVFTLARLHGADASTQFMNFYRAILKTQSIAALVKEVQSTMPAASR